MRNIEFSTHFYNQNHGIQEFVDSIGLDEGFDSKNAKYVIEGKINGELAGVVVYGIINVKRTYYPRFLHIVIHPEYRRSRFGYNLMKASETCFKSMGINILMAHILHSLPNRETKVKYALKFGYKKLYDTTDGELYAKEV